MGDDVVLILFNDLLAVGISGVDDIENGTYTKYNGKKYYYVETTGKDREIGEIPSDYARKLASIIYVN